MTAVKLPACLEVESYELGQIPPDRMFYLASPLVIYEEPENRTLKLSSSAPAFTSKTEAATTPVWRVGDSYYFDLNSAYQGLKGKSPIFTRSASPVDTVEVLRSSIVDILNDVRFFLPPASVHAAYDGTIWVPANTEVSLTEDFGFEGGVSVERCDEESFSITIREKTEQRRWKFQGEVPEDGAVTFYSILFIETDHQPVQPVRALFSSWFR
jgi:hypothetical protein